MIWRRLITAPHAGDALLALAISGAAYHHTQAVWLLYVIYLAAAISFFQIIKDVSSWVKSLSDAIIFHAKCIRDKSLYHSGRIDGSK